MDSPGINELLIVTEAQFRAVRENYNATSESLKRDIDSLIEWYKLQPHLPQIELDRLWLERLLIANKCSVQRTKNKIDMLISSRNSGADIFLNRDPEKTLKNVKKSTITVFLPKLMPDNTRVSFFKYTSDDANLYNQMEYIKAFMLVYKCFGADVFLIVTLPAHQPTKEKSFVNALQKKWDMKTKLFILLDYKQLHDYSVGGRYVIDIRGFTSSMITKINPLLAKRAVHYFRKAYGNRVTSVHVIFPNSLLEWLLRFYKTFLPAKLANRIKVHPDLDSLYQDIPREILPKEYGGEEMATEELFEKWENELCSDKQLKYFKDLENIRSDESKRIVELLNDDIFGVAGSFKSLNLD